LAFFVVIGILALIGLLATVITPFALTEANDVGAGGDRVVIAVVLGLITVLVLGVTTLLFAWEPVGAGHVGVAYGVGGNIAGTRAEGDRFQLPWQSTHIISVQRAVYRPENKCSNGQDNCLEAFSKDNQDVFVSVTLNYHIDPKNVEVLLRTNPNYIDRTIRSRVNQFVKDETVKYGSTEIAVHREDIRKAVTARLNLELAAASISAEDFFIDNIDFQRGFKEAIDRKVAAEQDALTEGNKVAVSEAQAKQKAAVAEGEANRLRIEAQGQADANALLNASLTPALLQFTAIQKLSDKISIMLLPSGGNFLIDPTKLAPAP
jgi:regulator of protease activity HflC (stomatin/prohibitin superfamily)